jgi:hypothetical protein
MVCTACGTCAIRNASACINALGASAPAVGSGWQWLLLTQLHLLFTDSSTLASKSFTYQHTQPVE